ncbi:hypothetical protein [Anaerobaca lacustris]|uniref:Uncharacterized protein n=1 Tax=Anaerobaca lacustris TaxID=3044600 RepID=A0AAW6TWC9_9BACT|nr:hypothetical protein [Sedimentisphaerales bacterium M17dextr]
MPKYRNGKNIALVKPAAAVLLRQCRRRVGRYIAEIAQQFNVLVHYRAGRAGRHNSDAPIVWDWNMARSIVTDGVFIDSVPGAVPARHVVFIRGLPWGKRLK